MTKSLIDFSETYNIYYASCIYLLKNLKNVQGNFLMGLIFRKRWRVASTTKKSHMGMWIFGILCTNVLELKGEHPCQILQVFRLVFCLMFLRICSQNKKMASLARTVPKPSAASPAHTVPNLLNFQAIHALVLHVLC